MRSGDSLNLDPRLQITVLNPPQQNYKGTRSDLNNNSVVMLIRYRRVAFLLTGDVEKEALADMAATARAGGEDLRADVYKAPHHGSATSIDPDLARLVRPQYVVISVGKNSFGHPSPETLQFWNERGVNMLRTDQDGAITFETDGERLLLKNPSPQSNQAVTSTD